LGVIRPIFMRGKRSMADHVRCYIRSAYSWGMKSEHDYRSRSPRRFKLVFNPAAGIPTEPKVVGTRWLDDDEWVQLYRWLECPDTPVHPPYLRAVQLIMLSGQRVEEIARFHETQWDAPERIIDWSKTKNTRPHAIPLPDLAAELVESIAPNEYGWYFPSAMDPSKPVSHTTLYAFMWRARDRGVIPHVTNRDLRRTWKTLAGIYAANQGQLPQDWPGRLGELVAGSTNGAGQEMLHACAIRFRSIYVGPSRAPALSIWQILTWLTPIRRASSFCVIPNVPAAFGARRRMSRTRHAASSSTVLSL
jgi:integrase